MTRSDVPRIIQNAQDDTLDLHGELRQTPSGQPTVADLVRPGDLVATNYQTGPYLVLGVTEYSTMLVGTRYRYWCLSCTAPDRSLMRKPPSNAHYWLNNYVAVDGRLLHLFGDNNDELFILDRARQPVAMRSKQLLLL